MKGHHRLEKPSGSRCCLGVADLRLHASKSTPLPVIASALVELKA